MPDVVTGSFLFWLGVTLAGLLLSAVFNEPLQRISFIAGIHRRLDSAQPYIAAILRIGLALSIVFQLITNSFLSPELVADQPWITVLLVLVLAGLVLQRTLPLSALFLSILYGTAIAKYGLFHALDYVFYVGIIYFLVVWNTKLRPTATPALYFFTGLSLAWVALEKMTMPELAYDIVVGHGIPTFGFSVEDFVLISAFIEMGLAWTFIVGILSRFISIVVTLVFIATTTVFGFKEIVGHTIVHTLLIMFLIEGEGTFKTPFQFHRSPGLRYLFVLVNFCLLLFGLMALYVAMAPQS
nr:hypothetical protein [Paenibacillus turpanensis]